MVGSIFSAEGVLTEFPTPILPNIAGEPTREALVELHHLIRSNAASIASNLGVRHHDHLTSTMVAEDYLAQTCHAFFPPHNPGYYLPTLGTA